MFGTERHGAEARGTECHRRLASRHRTDGSLASTLTSAIHLAQVGEAPHVAQTHGVGDTGEHELQRIAPLRPCLLHIPRSLAPRQSLVSARSWPARLLIANLINARKRGEAGKWGTVSPTLPNLGWEGAPPWPCVWTSELGERIMFPQLLTDLSMTILYAFGTAVQRENTVPPPFQGSHSVAGTFKYHGVTCS